MIAPCPRCGRICSDNTPPANRASQTIRRSTFKKGGTCASCALADWIKKTPALMMVIGMLKKKGLTVVDAFKLPHVRAQFAAIMKTGQSDATPDEIDWDHLAVNWELPS